MELTKDNFREVVNHADKPVLIDFWAPWCGPCRMQGPILDEVEADLSGEAIVAKVNIDENVDLAAECGVMSVPTLMVFKNGSMVDKSVGVTAKEDIISMVLDTRHK